MLDSDDIIQFTFRLMAAAIALQFAIHLVVFHRNKLGLLTSAAAICFVSYLVIPISRELWKFELTHQLILLLATSIPAMLWLVGKHYFDDDAQIPYWFWFAWILSLVLWLPNHETYLTELPDRAASTLFSVIPQFIKLGLVVHIIYLALQGRQSDLVATRLAMRIPIVLVAGSVTAIVIIIEIAAAGEVSQIIETVGAILLFFTALAGTLAMYRLRADFTLTAPLTQADAATTSTPPKPDDIQRIEHAMQENRFYAQHGATIADLADVLEMPAHRLRPIINQQLGFRNFNQFLNHYRIIEASARLTSEPNLPILTIALDSGFKSISSFNTAFRNTHQQTPSQYRHDHIQKPTP